MKQILAGKEPTIAGVAATADASAQDLKVVEQLSRTITASQPAGWVLTYRHIANGIRLYIASRRLSAKVKLPSYADLAAHLCLHESTVKRAYHELRDDGVIALDRRMRGYRVSREANFSALRQRRSDTRKAFREVIRKGRYAALNDDELLTMLRLELGLRTQTPGARAHQGTTSDGALDSSGA
jgi:DNA-binding transcriptional regulator YhcF (GntR family)